MTVVGILVLACKLCRGGIEMRAPATYNITISSLKSLIMRFGVIIELYSPR